MVEVSLVVGAATGMFLLLFIELIFSPIRTWLTPHKNAVRPPFQHEWVCKFDDGVALKVLYFYTQNSKTFFKFEKGDEIVMKRNHTGEKLFGSIFLEEELFDVGKKTFRAFCNSDGSMNHDLYRIEDAEEYADTGRNKPIQSDSIDYETVLSDMTGERNLPVDKQKAFENALRMKQKGKRSGGGGGLANFEKRETEENQE